MKRRAFIAMAGGMALAAPSVLAQNRAVPTIGFLNSTSPRLYEFNAAAFRKGLSETGFIEGQNLKIEYRWSDSDYSKLPALAKELADLKVAAIAATGDVVSAQAAKSATSTIPIVFTIGADPIRFGLVSSYNRPGGNVTGIHFITVGGKRIDVLHELAPGRSVGLWMNPDNLNAATEQQEALEAARKLGIRAVVLNTRRPDEFEATFKRFVDEGLQSLFVATDPMLLAQRQSLVDFAARRGVPGIYFVRQYVTAGGLISYGASITDMYYQAGIYVGRILNGAKPAELPVSSPSVFETVVNLRTAKSLGLTIPPSIMARADEIIE